MGVVLFAVAITLVGVLFFRFHPLGDVWDEADRFGVNPWLYVAGIIILAGAFFAIRWALLQGT